MLAFPPLPHPLFPLQFLNLLHFWFRFLFYSYFSGAFFLLHIQGFFHPVIHLPISYLIPFKYTFICRAFAEWMKWYISDLWFFAVSERILKPSEVAWIWYSTLGPVLYFTFNVCSWKHNTSFIFYLSIFLPALRVSVFQLLSHRVTETDISLDYLHLCFQQSFTSSVNYILCLYVIATGRQQ